MINKFNEDSRVKIPAILHLTRLGYTFLPKSKKTNINQDTNIFINVFKRSISKINNKNFTDSEIKDIDLPDDLKIINKLK